MKAANLRARVRAEMTEEIKQVAQRHLATDGANLSLRAVARDLGMASSAVYRYFASRDELLTAMIIDAYDAVGAAAEQAAETTDDPMRRWVAIGHAVRDWAVANPHQWALIYGSPVPGYQAPQDTVVPATRVIFALAATTQMALAQGRLGEVPAQPEGRFGEEMAAVAAQINPDAPAHLVGAVMYGFVHLCGAVSAELFGQLNNTIEDDRRGFFEWQMRAAGRFAGLL
ncbi:TetR family transcriptional regulator [Actinoplanes sp. SE50]|uniref:TetR/AcrR family transcriptional regulator n=1 Tax=unclassified Actinoplanes TaxID=2626549 RepID=UPI00023ED178|nr:MULTISPECIES: TetR/AcrR family transcriptional regulator [unclassified Actinoplanes]AEV81628.1 putative HTH-type transcriptional regulator [Actinoplanes sp. SE50/110]ATO80029.1 TetR family transcriptional regulator [Actinoplanes sp. SE50]SLL97433.1 TetR family transcriptional regulator [Actinoplanes sp. SE50/110]